MAAVGAAADMPAECGSAAGFDRAHHPALVAVEVLAARGAERGAVAAEDVRHLEAASHDAPPQAGGTTSSLSFSSGLVVRPMRPCETWV